MIVFPYLEIHSQAVIYWSDLLDFTKKKKKKQYEIHEETRKKKIENKLVLIIHATFNKCLVINHEREVELIC